MPDTNTPDLWIDHFQWPGVDAHKYRRGHVLVWGGARMVGAARLSARAAARTGAGLVTLVVPASVWPVYAAHLMSAMAHAVDDGAPDAATLLRSWRQTLDQKRWDVLVLGPGASTGLPGDVRAVMREMVLAALGHTGTQPLVLDADALMAFEGLAGALFDAVQRSEHPVVMTPHEGEFDRLLKGRTDKPLSKAACTMTAAQLSGAYVVHKGPQTVIASPDGRTVVNTHAPAWLATAGAGDVLAGMVAAFLAQGLPVMEAACMAVWLHGDCAYALGPGLLAEDLAEQVSIQLRRLKPWGATGV